MRVRLNSISRRGGNWVSRYDSRPSISMMMSSLHAAAPALSVSFSSPERSSLGLDAVQQKADNSIVRPSDRFARVRRSV